MRGKPIIGLVFLLLASAASSDAAVQQRSIGAVVRLTAWLEAVDRHQPGTADAPAVAIGQWSPSELLELAADLGIFLERLDRARALKPRERQILEPASERPQEVVNDIRAIADQVLHRGQPNQFLRRAALLHAEIALRRQAERNALPRPVASVEPQPPNQDERNGKIVIRAKDGVVLDIEGATRHWQIGRMVLESVSPDPVRDGIVRHWYRATIAQLLRNEEIAYARPQLAAALRIFANDAHLLLYAGALHETSANARVQAVVRGLARLPEVKPVVASPGTELKLAERFFRQSLEADPRLAEARLRLGRVLGVQGRHEEAATEIRRVSPQIKDSQLLYYAELFLGQEEAELGRRGAARDCFVRAGALYPRAQSPHLALALLARAHGDRPAMLHAMKAVFALPPNEKDREDPWWEYHTAYVRDADALLDQLRLAVLTGGQL